MVRANELTGKRFGKLVALKRWESAKGGRAQWLCRCDCGNTKVVRAAMLTSGRSTDCGCVLKEKFRVQSEHSVKKDRLYRVWGGMKKRCYNKNDHAYKNYGGRGIEVCDEWRDDYRAFREWAYSTGYDKNAKRGECTIDRINNDGNYEPSNCRWVNAKVQANNRRKRKAVS